MNLLEFYKACSDRNKTGDAARAVRAQSHWFASNAEFDPRTGEALPQSLSAFLAKAARPDGDDGIRRDRLWRIAEHSRASVERLFRTLNESPRREHALLPVYAARELDASSLVKLNQRPGRNIREKLAGNPYLHAVRRFQSVDLPENRLLKVFVTRLAELLELRRDYLHEEDEDLLPSIRSWLRSDDARAIAAWDNLPPNNALLSHRDYGRVWDAWRWLQTLDEDIARDFTQHDARARTMQFWSDCGKMWANGSRIFAEMPLLFDFENFRIDPWLSPLPILKSEKGTSRQPRNEEVTEAVCVDLNCMRPRYATKATRSRALRETYLWQQWKREGESVDIELFAADAAYLHTDASSVSSSDIFFSRQNTSDHVDRAARAFASKLRGVFKSETLIWLVPDALNDFELEVARRHLNARFRDANPLPRSVAAAFEQVDYAKIRHDGYAIVVVDRIGKRTCVTKLLARFNSELSKRLPETAGYYWERCPPVVLSTDDDNDSGLAYDIVTLDGQRRWHGPARPVKPEPLDLDTLKRDPRIGQFVYCITLLDSPVDGGIRLHSFQERAGDIPLWSDQISELSIKVMKDGRYQRFHLVSRGTTVQPVPGLAVPIAVNEEFTLPAGKAFYQFPLFQGENADEVGFSARLDSNAFPYREDVTCKLNLTFEYGADEPYKLVFTPIDKSLPPVRATWRKTDEIVITQAPAPSYPAPLTWADLQHFGRAGSDETTDLLDWVLRAVPQLEEDLGLRPRQGKERTIGEIMYEWSRDKNGACFTYARNVEVGSRIFIHQANFVDGVSYEDFGKGDTLSFELGERGGRLLGMRIAAPDYQEPTPQPREVVERIRKRLYFPIIQVWRDGRSISDPGCPPEFAKAMRTRIDYLASLLRHDGVPGVIQYQILFLLSCMHKDAPDECIRRIREQVQSPELLDPQSVGFSLGDVTEQWQEEVLSELAARPAPNALRAFARAIWRQEHFVERFSAADLKKFVAKLADVLDKLNQSAPQAGEKDRKRLNKWGRDAVEPLELLLGLLRTRASPDPRIGMLLQPNQKITRVMAAHVERIAEIVGRSDIKLLSRVQIDIQKPEGESRTPDLLYALRLYLTGDDGAHAIHIAGVSESDND